MAQTALVNPALTINNQGIRYIEDSLVYNEGDGEVNFRTHTAGPGDVEVVTSEVIGTKIGMVKFTLLSTEENAELVSEWQRLIGLNGITLSQGGFTRTFSAASVSNNPDKTAGNDQSFEVEFKSNPAA